MNSCTEMNAEFSLIFEIKQEELLYEISRFMIYLNAESQSFGDLK